MDHILYWNAVALEANRRDAALPIAEQAQSGALRGARALAIVHLAMYDAQVGVIAHTALPRYLPMVAVPSAWANPAAAVAAAANACLCALYPAQKAFFLNAHQAAGLAGRGLVEGHMFGLAVAHALLADRANDLVSTVPWRSFAITARLSPEAITRATPSASRAPNAQPQRENTTKRSVDETLLGLYWAFDGSREGDAPLRLYNKIVRGLAVAKGNSVDDNARLFAFANAAMADAGILAWPAAVEAQALAPDVAPAKSSVYPSEHATFGAAAFQIARLFYGTTSRPSEGPVLAKGQAGSRLGLAIAQDIFAAGAGKGPVKTQLGAPL